MNYQMLFMKKENIGADIHMRRKLMRACWFAQFARASIALACLSMIFSPKTAFADPPPIIDCHQWFPYGYTHAWEVGQARAVGMPSCHNIRQYA
jgi:hypothetical protein